jgi:HEAT repeat protein
MALSDPLPEIRRAALGCLRRGAPLASQQALVTELALHDGSLAVRLDAVRSLGGYAVEGAVVRLLGWLTLDADPRVAAAAAIALHGQGQPESLVALCWRLKARLEAGQGLHPGFAAVIRYAGTAAGGGLVADDSVIAALVESRWSEDRGSVAGVLIRHARNPGFVTRLVGDPDPGVRAVLVAALVAEGQPGWQAAARRGLADPSVVVQRAAVSALDRSGSQSALSLLRGNTPRGRTRLAECCALARHGDPEGAWRLLRSPRTAKPDRVRLLVAMVKGGVPTAAADLLAMLDEPSPRLREQVARSLSQLRPAQAFPALARALADRDLGVRVAAAGAVLALAGEHHSGQDLSH